MRSDLLAIRSYRVESVGDEKDGIACLDLFERTAETLGCGHVHT